MFTVLNEQLLDVPYVAAFPLLTSALSGGFCDVHTFVLKVKTDKNVILMV